MSPSFRELEGVGLFSGVPCVVRLVRDDEPGVRLALPGAFGPPHHIEALTVLETDRRVVVGCAGARVELVEHLAAALGGLGVRDGLSVEVSGPELPLLDGGAAAYCAALSELKLRASAPRLRVVADGDVRVGDSLYVFSRGERVEVEVEVEVDFDLPGLAREAQWAGDPLDFAERIAPARTFVLAREIQTLVDRGLAAHADPRSIVVLGDAGPMAALGEVAPDEPARHKLLDLVGDLTLHGGPPLGRVYARRPGHGATHRAVALALAAGLLAPARAKRRESTRRA